MAVNCPVWVKAAISVLAVACCSVVVGARKAGFPAGHAQSGEAAVALVCKPRLADWSEANPEYENGDMAAAKARRPETSSYSLPFVLQPRQEPLAVKRRTNRFKTLDALDDDEDDDKRRLDDGDVR
jgi:hypothetical protein